MSGLRTISCLCDLFFIFIIIFTMINHGKFSEQKNNKKAPSKCLSIIMLDSVIKARKKYYPQTLLYECKYEQEKIKMDNLIDDDLGKSWSDASDNYYYYYETEFDNDESNE